MAARQRYRRTAGVNLAGNLLKLVVEGVPGLWFGSAALLADAADSLADLLTSGLALFLGDQAYEEEDAGHPHGHERFEPLAAFVVGAVMVVAGLEIGGHALRGLINPQPPKEPFVLLAGAVAAIGIKVVLYRYNRLQADHIASTSLRALASDARNDVVKSGGVAIAIAGAAAGFVALEAGVGVVVSVIVVYEGVSVLRENTRYLVGAAPPRDKIEAVRSMLLSDEAVHGMHDLVIHHLGPLYEVEVHIEVDGDMPLRNAHDVETRLVDRMRDVPWIGDAHVHLDPAGS